MSKKNKPLDPVIAQNKKARKEFEIIDSFEAGIVLVGTEVKSLRAGLLNFKDSYAAIENNELWIYNMHINEYLQGNRNNHRPERKRKLLMHKIDILRLGQDVQKTGLTLIPLKLYFKGSIVKVELGLCKGKKIHDQRQDIAKRDAQREIDQELKRRR